MSRDGQTIRSIRQRLIRARRAGEVALLAEVTDGLAELGRRGYRCCLVDYESCRPAFYVRLLGFEPPRIRAELEFPIEPHLEAVQLVPLSHLVDYDEAADPGALRRIYDDLGEYLHHRRAPLSRNCVYGEAAVQARPRAAAQAEGRSRTRHGGTASRDGSRADRDARRDGRWRLGEGRRPARPGRPRVVRRVLMAAGVWWGIAGVLLSYGLFVFLVL